MDWVYIGGGCWELQGGIYLGCCYGTKGGDTFKCTIEKWTEVKRGDYQWVALWEQEDVEGYRQAQKLVTDKYIEMLQERLDQAKALHGIWFRDVA